MFNKNGKAGNGFKIFGVFAVIIFLGLVIWMATSQTQLGDGDLLAVLETSPASCGVATVLDMNVVNELSQGTSVTATINAKVDGGPTQIITSATNLAPGNVLEILLNASNFIDETFTLDELVCGTNSVGASLKATNTQAVTIKNDADTATLTDDATGTASPYVNESAFTAGGSKTWEISVTGNDKQTTGNMVVVVELGNESSVSTLTMSDSSGNSLEKLANVPTGLTISGSNQDRTAFVIPSFDGAIKNKYNLNVALTSGNVIDGAVYVTFYSEQAFIDSEGPYTSGVVDSDGSTTKFEDTFDYDFFIQT